MHPYGGGGPAGRLSLHRLYIALNLTSAHRPVVPYRRDPEGTRTNRPPLPRTPHLDPPSSRTNRRKSSRTRFDQGSENPGSLGGMEQESTNCKNKPKEYFYCLEYFHLQSTTYSQTVFTLDSSTTPDGPGSVPTGVPDRNLPGGAGRDRDGNEGPSPATYPRRVWVFRRDRSVSRH